MGRGYFTKKEVELLKRNENVSSVDEFCIYYTNAFKLKFMEEYLQGKSPTRIFEENGFPKSVVGSKRIERATSRWKESYKANTSAKRKSRKHSERMEFYREEIEKLNRENKVLLKELAKAREEKANAKI